MIEIPREKAADIVRYHGEKGSDWLESLEQRIDRLRRAWNLEIESLLPGGLYCNLVYRATQGRDPVILKIGFPEPELFTEMRTLALWRGYPHRVQLIDSDESAGAILLPALEPGTTLREAAPVVRKQCLPHLHQAMPIKTDAKFPHWQDWFDNARSGYRGDDSEWHQRIELAARMLEGMMASFDVDWLLHGDLHHENILLVGADSWTAIDPKGVLGPRVMDYGRFMHNFIGDELGGDESIEEILLDRASRLSGEFSSTEIIMAGFVDLVVGSLWTVNGPGDLSQYQENLLTSYTGLANRQLSQAGLQ